MAFLQLRPKPSSSRTTCQKNVSATPEEPNGSARIFAANQITLVLPWKTSHCLLAQVVLEEVHLNRTSPHLQLERWHHLLEMQPQIQNSSTRRARGVTPLSTIPPRSTTSAISLALTSPKAICPVVLQIPNRRQVLGMVIAVKARRVGLHLSIKWDQPSILRLKRWLSLSPTWRCQNYLMQETM